MISEKGDFNQMILGSGYWQARICNIEACIAKTCLDGPTIQFNLVLEDPIEKYLTPSMPWRGISGEYIITLGNKSKASVGSASNLQTLKASVGAFTRLWRGVRPASGLATTDNLQAPPELLEKLAQKGLALFHLHASEQSLANSAYQCIRQVQIPSSRQRIASHVRPI